MYGGEISNIIQGNNINNNTEECVLPENMDSPRYYEVRGAAIYLQSSTLNIFGGKICNNKGINNSEIYSNENSTNGDYTLNQRFLGAIIYSDNVSNVNLYKGEISDNIAINNSKSNIIAPKNGKITNIYGINSCIYGSILYLSNSLLTMYDDFIITNNSSNLNTTINIEKNCIVKKIDSVRKGQIYYTSSRIKINGGIIQNTNNKKNITSSIEPNEGSAKNISNNTLGGAIDFIECQVIEKNNIKIRKCNGDNGGGIYFDSNNKRIISNSEISNNTANYGGGIYISSKNIVQLNNVKILNNLTKEGIGGGIYAYGYLTIDGEKINISNNIAEAWGGGIMVKTKTTINNCVICNNKAMTESGGGIEVDGGELYLNKAKIYKNWCNKYGGGIYCPQSKLFISNKDEINNMIYNNKAEKAGDNLYPFNNSG